MPSVPPAHAGEPVRSPDKACNPAPPPLKASAAAPSGTPGQKSPLKEPHPVPVYRYRIVHSYPHDPGAFTQGLLYHDGHLYEGTGLHGRSSLRKVELETGRVLKLRDLPHRYFGEGIAICANRLFQLTYRSGIGFVYDLDLRPAGSFTYAGEGWGLTCDGSRLILSDGTAKLRWLDTRTFRIVRELVVTHQGRPLGHLNELEYVRGEIFANVWQTDRIARISPETGAVTGWIDLGGLSSEMGTDTKFVPISDKSVPVAVAGSETGPVSAPPEIDVLNGIAYDERGDRLFVTGKHWPKLFEIRLMQK